MRHVVESARARAIAIAAYKDISTEVVASSIGTPVKRSGIIELTRAYKHLYQRLGSPFQQEDGFDVPGQTDSPVFNLSSDERESESEKFARKCETGLATVAQLYTCLEVWAENADVRLPVTQLYIVQEIWGCNLPTIVGSFEVYDKIKHVIKAQYGLEYRAKVNDFVLGRRAGKSFAMCLALAAMAAVCPTFKATIFNLFGPAAQQNLAYIKEFISCLEKDEQQRIRCRFVRHNTAQHELQIESDYVYREHQRAGTFGDSTEAKELLSHLSASPMADSAKLNGPCETLAASVLFAAPPPKRRAYNEKRLSNPLYSSLASSPEALALRAQFATNSASSGSKAGRGVTNSGNHNNQNIKVNRIASRPRLDKNASVRFFVLRFFLNPSHFCVTSFHFCKRLVCTYFPIYAFFGFCVTSLTISQATTVKRRRKMKRRLWKGRIRPPCVKAGLLDYSIIAPQQLIIVFFFLVRASRSSL